MKFYHETIIPQVNVVEPRSYYIPFTDTNFSLDITKSKQVKKLSRWKFEYFANFSEELLYYKPNEEYTVPFVWQLKGFDNNQYSNFFYPYPFDPPHILKENPCGIYETTIDNLNIKKKNYIVFEGVDSCLYLFVNNQFVGYSSGSHCICEFDISKYLKLKENIIKVIVLKWCCGSYFEDQDKLRMSGIFRDCYIIERPIKHIKDYVISSSIKDNKGLINIKCDKNIKVSIYDSNDILITNGNGKNINLEIKKPFLWSSENPYLYKIIIYYNKEYILENFGFRDIKIKGNVFYLNDKNIKIKGVNRNSMTVDGYVETYDLLKKDILMFKENNINAIRTSHYPPTPLFTKLCDLYGIYILEEADIETHGLETIHYYGDCTHFDDFANNPLYYKIYFNRVNRMYERDKNRTSVIIWSMGNEAGWGVNFKKCSDFLHSVDTRPVHYEGNTTRNLSSQEFRDSEYLDFYSMMYASPKECKKRLNSGLDKPFILCEYSHAMGNSCGDLRQYWDIIYKEKGFLGGFVWEWCNHTVKTKGGQFLFGGDFNEKDECSKYDGSFCVDGLVDTDRRPHPSLLELKQVYAPIDVKRSGTQKFIIKNRYDFSSLDKVRCFIYIEKNSRKEFSTELSLVGIKPGQKKVYTIDIPLEDYMTINFDFYIDKELICFRQFILSNKLLLTNFNNLNDRVVCYDKHQIVTNKYKLTLDERGNIASIITDKELLKKPVGFCLFRSPIDNDKSLNESESLFNNWKRERIEYARTWGQTIEKIDNSIVVKGKIVSDIVEPLYDYKITYSFYNDYIKVNVFAKKRKWVSNVARFGLLFVFNNDFKECEYFGNGKEESYSDRNLSSKISYYKECIDNMNYNYCKMQYSGNHINTRLVKLISQMNNITFFSDSNFNFTISKYEFQDFEKHLFEMPINTNKTVLNIDYKVTGIGSASCGASLPKKYLVDETYVSYNFKIIVNGDYVL